MEEKKFDYVRLWRTLIRVGLKQRFSDVRVQFFMKLATDGPVRLKGVDKLQEIIEQSYLFSMVPELSKDLSLFIGEDDEFKHYDFSLGDIAIEYFANISTKSLREGFIKSFGTQDDYNVDGVCLSQAFRVITEVENPTAENDDNEGEATEPEKQYVEETRTGHLICIAEGEETVNPDNYPKVIKHELAHACLYEIQSNFHEHKYDDMRIPSTWSDEEIDAWNKDLQYLNEMLSDDSDEAKTFREFVCDFIMYESDGQTKEKNPIKESRVPKTNNPNGKPRITYRTLSPIDRFEEQHLDTLNDELRNHFTEIINDLRNEYEDYDKFLDSCKMG